VKATSFHKLTLGGGEYNKIGHSERL